MSPLRSGVAEIPLRSLEGLSLDEIQLRVARRADELARERHRHTSIDLDCWLLAEAEVWRDAGVFPLRRS